MTHTTPHLADDDRYSNDAGGSDDLQHVILVAIALDTSGSDARCVTRHQAMDLIADHLQSLSGTRDEATGGEYSWWIAEDDRIGNADCDSAVFCHMGRQHVASTILASHAFSGTHNIVPIGRSAESSGDGTQV